jgi:adenosylcobinamide-GDP ribazoletransferase
MALALQAFPYARSEGRGTAFKAGVGSREVALATWWAVLMLAGLHLRWLWLLVVVWVAAMALGRWMAGRLGGLTGDSYGAICELVTALTLVLLSGRFA